RFLKILKWTLISLLLLVAVGIAYLRFSRMLDPQIYRADYTNEKIESPFDFQEMSLALHDGTQIHAALFLPADSLPIKATIFHHVGNGMSLNDSQKHFYAPLIQDGYQIFSYERRGYGQSTGTADNSQVLRNDANEVFDQMLALESVQDSKIIVWGTSIGGIFATTNAAAKNDRISGLIIESAFSSFPAVAKFYASEINMGQFKFLIPLILNNDFPTKGEIKKITKPVVIIHSTEDKRIPFEFSEDIYENANKETTEFWKIKGKHVRGIIDYETEYVTKFNQILNQ
ncbi:MAG: alpha/beta fold hydrolase, partial [Bacteroidota bacterium]